MIGFHLLSPSVTLALKTFSSDWGAYLMSKLNGQVAVSCGLNSYTDMAQQGFCDKNTPKLINHSHVNFCMMAIYICSPKVLNQDHSVLKLIANFRWIIAQAKNSSSGWSIIPVSVNFGVSIPWIGAMMWLPVKAGAHSSWVEGSMG
jgi:hypothetical protein